MKKYLVLGILFVFVLSGCEKNEKLIEKSKESDVSAVTNLAHGFSKDDNNVYFKSGVIDGLDAETFEMLNQIYLKDKNNIYIWRCAKIFGCSLEKMDADIESFRLLSGIYARDESSIFYIGTKFRNNVEVNSFEVIDRTSYGKDKNNVYFATTKIDNADLNTFKVFKNDDGMIVASDKKDCYIGDEIVDLSVCE